MVSNYGDKNEHLELNSYQQEYLNEIKKLIPTEAPLPWGNRIVLSAAGIVAGGWTADNQVLLLSHDGYSISNPLNGKMLFERDNNALNNLLSKENHSLLLPSGESVQIFGIFGGDGNHVTSEGWQLEIMYPAWPNAIITIRRPFVPGEQLAIWQGITLIKLTRLEYIDLKCGFSYNEKAFMILGSGGAEVFCRQ